MDDVSMIKSVAAINAMKGNRIIASAMTTVKTEICIENFHLETYDVSKSKEMVRASIKSILSTPLTLFKNISTTKSYCHYRFNAR